MKDVVMPRFILSKYVTYLSVNLCECSLRASPSDAQYTIYHIPHTIHSTQYSSIHDCSSIFSHLGEKPPPQPVLLDDEAHERLKAIEPVVVAWYSIADGTRVPEIGLYAENRLDTCVYRQHCLPFEKERVRIQYTVYDIP